MLEVLNISVLVLRKSTRSISEAFILILFFGSIFLLLGKQLYKGVLTQKCVQIAPENISDSDYSNFVSNTSHWLRDANGIFMCGNGTGARACPPNYICLKGAELNSFHVSNFDFYASSVVTISQLMTLHFWQKLYQRMLLTAGTLHMAYFVLAFYTFYYLGGLILAIITRSYQKVFMEVESTDKATSLAYKENGSRSEASKGIVKSPSCKSYELFISHVKSSDPTENFTADDTQIKNEMPGDPQCSRKGFTVGANLLCGRKIRSRFSNTNNSDHQIRNRKCCSVNIMEYSALVRCTIRRVMSSWCIGIIVLMFTAVNFTAMAFHQSMMNQNLENSLKIEYYSFAALSLTETILKIIGFGPRNYFCCRWNIFDFIITMSGSIEIFVPIWGTPMLLLFRAVGLIKILGLTCSPTCGHLTSAVSCSFNLLGHPTIVLMVFTSICLVCGMHLYGTEYFHSSERFSNEEYPRWFFKDTYSSILLVFCMLCGDWKQPVVNAILFTSRASDLLLLLFVLLGNLVVMNLFSGILFYMFFYKSMTMTSCLKDDKIQQAIRRLFCMFQEKKTRQSQIQDEASKSKIEGINTGGISSTPTSLNKIIPESIGIEIYQRGRRRGQYIHKNGREMEIIEDTSSEYMADCCPALCYFCCSFCSPDKNPVFWQTWADLRCRVYCLVETKVFRIVITLVIIGSVGILVIDKSYGTNNQIIAKISRIIELTVMFIFFLEVLLKWMAYGLQKYFNSSLGRLEFIIILVYLADMLTIQLFNGQRNIFKSLRAFRLISVLNLLKSYQELPPLPVKRSSCGLVSENASRESLLHLKKAECDHFLGRHCRYRTSESLHVFAPDSEQIDWQRSTVCTPDVHCIEAKPSKSDHILTDGTLPVHAVDCLPSRCYSICPCCRRNCMFWHNWKVLRTAVVYLVESRCFIVFIALTVIFSSVLLALEDVHFYQISTMVLVVSYADKVLMAVFLMEMLLKLFGLGFKQYFNSSWCLLEFLSTVTFTLYIVLLETGTGNFTVLKIIRVIRLLYLGKAFAFNRQAQAVLSSLGQSVQSYLLTLSLCVFLWLFFAVPGVFMFKNKFYRCIDENEDDVVDVIADNFEESCLLKNGTYQISPINFNNIRNSYIVLLQVATLQNWLSLVTNIMDISKPEDQVKMKISTAVFFPLFIMFSTFFTLNFFVGVTLRSFKQFKKDQDKRFVSESQKLYYSAVKKMKKIKLSKVIPEPCIHFSAFIYRMVTSDNFEVAGFVFIGLHMLLIALDMYDPDPSEMFALAMTELNLFFIIIFSVECVLKLIAQRFYYATKIWNLFDVLVLALCIAGVMYEDNLSISPMLPAMLRLFRFVKAMRYFRRYMRGMIPLISTLYKSIPAMLAIIILQVLIMFVYSIFGMHFFKNISCKWGVTEELNFKTFMQSMLILFQLSTLSGWKDTLLALFGDASCVCSSEHNDDYCNNKSVAIIYIISYLILVYFVTIKTHLVIILDNYECSMRELETIPLKEDYEMFVEIWQKFDREATGIIKFNKLFELLDVLEEPFRFEKPNKFLIVSLNIPIYEGDLVFYGDVMDALTRDFLIQNGHTLQAPKNVPALLDKNGRILKKISSTLWRQRQNHCAQIIQKAWKKYTGHSIRTNSPIFCSEVRLSMHRNKVDTFLASQDSFGDNASV